MCPLCYHSGGSLLHCLSTLTPQNGAVYFCCTGLGVTSTGRYPASCPVKPGLSSSATFRHLQPRPSVLLCVSVSNYITDYSMCQFPDLSTSFRNPLPLSPARHTAHSADVRHGPSPSGTSPDGSLSLSEAVSTGRYS